MATLGRCLVFYLRHAPEMNRLYGVKEPQTNGLEDAARVLEMAENVGQQASREVADFLEECSAAIKPHLATICQCEVARKRRSIEKTWSVAFNIRSLGDTRRDALQLGVWLHDRLTAILPWVWCQGGKRAEEAALQILGARADSESRRIESGTVNLSRIPIPLPAGADDVPTEPLIQQVVHSIAALTRSDIDALLNRA